MVNFGYPTVAETMPMATKAADDISAIFPKPIKIEFEKIYYPYLLMNKKRYAGTHSPTHLLTYSLTYSLRFAVDKQREI
jgi:DNA polymerase elongation subunit (family B)